MRDRVKRRIIGRHVVSPSGGETRGASSDDGGDPNGGDMSAMMKGRTDPASIDPRSVE
jgi:hypothetical protein